MINEIKSATEAKMTNTVKALENDFNALRTGRATPALFDKVMVDYYGSMTPLAQTANISVPEARTIVIQPWDKSTLSAIEKAILAADLGFNPSNDGKIIRISVPPLTEDRRKELVKQAKASAEQSRVSIRNARRDANDELKKVQKNGDISEDDLKKGETEVQKLTDTYVAKIDDAVKAKEKEIMEV